MVAIVLPVVLLYVATHGISDIVRNFKSNYWLIGLLGSALLVGISYFTHGASSQELRGLLVALVYLSVLPKDFITARRAQSFVFIASIACFILSIWFLFVVPTDRLLWPTNPIPLAIHQGTIYLLALAMLITPFKGRKLWVLVATMIFSGFSMLPTESRGAILGVLSLSIFMLLVYLFRKKVCLKHLLVILIVMFLGVFMAKDPLTSRVSDTLTEIQRIKSGDMNSSIGLRVQMYLAGIELFLQKPVVGHGEVSSKYAKEHAPGYTKKAYRYMNGHFHNNYIDKLAKSGLIGMFFLSFLLVYPLYLAGSRYKGCFWVLVLPSLYYITTSFFDSPFRNGDTTVLYLIVIGMTLHVASSNQNKVIQT